MTLLLNAAIDPGFVAVQRDGQWAWKPLALGRGGPFPGAIVEALGVDVRQLAEIIVVHGPGSSTGLRTVCSYANAIAQVSGAKLFQLPSFDIVAYFHPDRPQMIAFRQPMGRIVLASRMANGKWESYDEPQPPEGTWFYDPAALPVLPDMFPTFIIAAEASELAIPRYWAAPTITKPATR